MKTFFISLSVILLFSCKNSDTKKPEIEMNSKILESSVHKKASENSITIEKTIEKVNDVKNTAAQQTTNTVTETVKEITPVKEKVSEQITSKISEKKELEVEQHITTPKEVLKEEKITEVKETIVAKANHNSWDKLAKNYVSSNGKVNYKGFKSQLSTIEAYLLHLEQTPPTKYWSRNEKLAYWFNLYNAATIHLVASNYPVKSIKDINNGKPWDKKFIKSGSNTYSLNDIENTIVRPNYNEPRLHVAFNCAAVSCPNLLNGAFSPTKLNNQLNALSKKWLSDTSKNTIAADTIEISKIFNWYKVDFKEGVISFINKYSNAQVLPTATITYKEYNWSLNE